ncbi:hypothetical protein EON67_06045 [archaeon]|nr:MAG: hypothetical protein EON67_06045 [archaeon]
MTACAAVPPPCRHTALCAMSSATLSALGVHVGSGDGRHRLLEFDEAVQRKKARAGVEALRRLTAFDRSHDVVDVCMRAATAFKSSKGESENNKLLRAVYEYMYACWAAGLLSRDAAARYAKRLLSTDLHDGDNPARRIAALQLLSVLTIDRERERPDELSPKVTHDFGACTAPPPAHTRYCRTRARAHTHTHPSSSAQPARASACLCMCALIHQCARARVCVCVNAHAHACRLLAREQPERKPVACHLVCHGGEHRQAPCARRVHQGSQVAQLAPGSGRRGVLMRCHAVCHHHA